MNTSKEKISGLVGTSIFHLLLVLFLLFYYIKPSFDTRFANDLEGVPVMFGNVPDAFGDDEAFGRGRGAAVNASVEESQMVAATPETTTPKVASSPNTANSNVATQEFEETVAIKKAEKEAAEKKKQEQLVAEQQRIEKAEAQKVAQAQADAKKNINSQMSGVFGNGTGSGSRGNTTGPGTQGVQTGNASHGKTSGVGVVDGTYDLGGRGVGSGGLVKPPYAANADGKIVVDIVVDARGNVVSATPGRGTTAVNATLHSEALSAARKTKFNTVTTLGNQKGTITYMFNFK